MTEATLIHFLRPTMTVRAVCGEKWSPTFHGRNYEPETVTCPACRARLIKDGIAKDSGPVFVAVGPHAWGKGATQEIAVKNCKREIPRSLLKKGKHNINVFRVVGFNYVSDVDGSISYQKDGTCERVDTVQITVTGR